MPDKITRDQKKLLEELAKTGLDNNLDIKKYNAYLKKNK